MITETTTGYRATCPDHLEWSAEGSSREWVAGWLAAHLEYTHLICRHCGDSLLLCGGHDDRLALSDAKNVEAERWGERRI